MTLEQFNNAMAIIAQHHSTEVKINMPKNRFVGNLGNTEFSLHITKCCASVVNKLTAKGYSLSMDGENGLSVTWIYSNQMKKRNIRRPRKRCNISQPILESSSITNEQLQDFVYHALQEMRPLCSNSDTHHHRSISHRIGDSRISIEVSLTPWNIHSEAFGCLERL